MSLRRWSRASAHLAGASRRYLRGLWRLAGSRQCIHGCAALGLACLVVIAYELGGVAHELGTIAQAQAISAYAVLRQLQAPGSQRLAAAGSGRGSAPAAPGPIAAIDPLLLGTVEGRRAAPIPSSSAGAAHGP